MPKALQEEGLEEAKVQYYDFLVKFYTHEKDYMNAAQSYRTIYDACMDNDLHKEDRRTYF